MKINVVCFGVMREYLPSSGRDRRAELDVEPGSTVDQVIDALGIPRRLVFAVLVDGQQAPVSETLRDGCEVTLMPPFAGGAFPR